MAPWPPLINDITTDFEQPPLFWAAPPADPAYDAARYRRPTEAGYPGLSNLQLAASPEAAWNTVLALVEERGWRIAARDDAGKRVQAVATTRLLRFRDDIVIEVRPGPRPNSATVAMRSKSRLGRGDLGANAKRIRAFIADVRHAVP